MSGRKHVGDSGGFAAIRDPQSYLRELEGELSKLALPP
jgi:hypothetical protein